MAGLPDASLCCRRTPASPSDDFRVRHALAVGPVDVLLQRLRLLLVLEAAAGVGPSWLHAARHSAATHLIGTDTDIRIVQEILGHARVTTTGGYVDVAMEVKRQAVERMVAAMMEASSRGYCKHSGPTVIH